MRFMDVVREDVQVVGMKEEDGEDRIRWRRLIRCGGEKPKEKQECNKLLSKFLYKKD